jgi:hypothetical protein
MSGQEVEPGYRVHHPSCCSNFADIGRLGLDRRSFGLQLPELDRCQKAATLFKLAAVPEAKGDSDGRDLVIT